MKYSGLEDWRGNKYKKEVIGKCEYPNCKKNALRQECTAEGDIGRTHWHGRVHILTKKGVELMALCDKHYKELTDKQKRG